MYNAGSSEYQDKHADHNTIISENLEVVSPDVLHQESDDEDGYNKRNGHAEKQNTDLTAAESSIVLGKLQHGSAKHGRDREKEGKLSRHRSDRKSVV